jgi:uncharacterized membrane-anchored protein
MEGILWKNHKGVEILYLEMSKAKSEAEVALMMNEVVKQILERPQGTVRYLTNMENGYVSPATMNHYKNGANKVNNHVKLWAMCGISPIKKMILDLLKTTIGIKVSIFNTIEEAEEWLIRQ